jgi:hypothetical protein
MRGRLISKIVAVEE